MKRRIGRKKKKKKWRNSRSYLVGWAHCPRASVRNNAEGWRATVARAFYVVSSTTSPLPVVPIYPQQSPVLAASTWRTHTYPPTARPRRRLCLYLFRFRFRLVRPPQVHTDVIRAGDGDVVVVVVRHARRRCCFRRRRRRRLRSDELDAGVED